MGKDNNVRQANEFKYNEEGQLVDKNTGQVKELIAPDTVIYGRDYSKPYESAFNYSGAETVREGLGLLPIAGDALDGIDALFALSNGNYTEAGLLGAGLLLPNFLEKPFKWLGGKKAAKEIIEEASTELSPYAQKVLSNLRLAIANNKPLRDKGTTSGYSKIREQLKLLGINDSEFTDAQFRKLEKLHEKAIDASIKPEGRYVIAGRNSLGWQGFGAYRGADKIGELALDANSSIGGIKTGLRGVENIEKKVKFVSEHGVSEDLYNAAIRDAGGKADFVVGEFLLSPEQTLRVYNKFPKNQVGNWGKYRYGNGRDIAPGTMLENIKKGIYHEETGQPIYQFTGESGRPLQMKSKNGFDPTLIDNEGNFIVDWNNNSIYSKGGYISRPWNTLSLQEKSSFIRTGVKNGLYSLQEIQDAYNKFDKGGPKDGELSDLPRDSYEVWRSNLPENLRNPDFNYDLYEAYKSGAVPRYNEEDGLYHLPTRNPYNGQILKSPAHPTYLKGMLEDAKLGYYPVNKEGKTYTQKYNFPYEFAYGGNLYKDGGGSWYTPSTEVKKRIAKWEGKAMYEKQPDTGRANYSFEEVNREFLKAIPKEVRPYLNQTALDALYSYFYNVGGGSFRSKGVPKALTQMISALKSGNQQAIEAAVKNVTTHMYGLRDSEPKMGGLRTRRAKERAAFTWAMTTPDFTNGKPRGAYDWGANDYKLEDYEALKKFYSSGTPVTLNNVAEPNRRKASTQTMQEATQSVMPYMNLYNNGENTLTLFPENSQEPITPYNPFQETQRPTTSPYENWENLTNQLGIGQNEVVFNTKLPEYQPLVYPNLTI